MGLAGTKPKGLEVSDKLRGCEEMGTAGREGGRRGRKSYRTNG